jgi:hypothetical protein
LRTHGAHEYHVNSVEKDNSLPSVYGVKCASPFAGTLLYNSTQFFPPDVMHDVLEGLMSVNVSLVIRSFVRQNKITVKIVNERIQAFQFGPSDKCDKYGPLPLDFVSRNRLLSGKAVEK